jgi:hypothetical protein
MAVQNTGAGTGGAGTGGATGTGGAALKGGSGNAAPTKTPISYRDNTSWPTFTLYSEVT